MNSTPDRVLRLALYQMDIRWCDPAYNLNQIEYILPTIKGKCDLLILPETFTTGFSAHELNCAEAMDGATLTKLKKWAQAEDIAFVGSFIAKEEGRIYNRGFFVTPTACYFYDKHHLFQLGGEEKIFSSGEKQCIVPYKGWNIALQICYDLRFPVWCRNVANGYDLLVVVANWPSSRQAVWDTLLKARAIENIAYVAGVNRVGIDAEGIKYVGGSQLIDMKGSVTASIPLEKVELLFCQLSKNELKEFRTKFPVWKDADTFKIIFDS